MTNLQRQSKRLAEILLSVKKLNKKNNPKMTLPKLKKKSPFFLGNFVTNKSFINKKFTEREIRSSFNETSKQYIGTKVSSDLLKWELNSIIIHVCCDFYNCNEQDDSHVFVGFENVKNWWVLFVCVVLFVLLCLSLDHFMCFYDHLLCLCNLWVASIVILCYDF